MLKHALVAFPACAVLYVLTGLGPILEARAQGALDRTVVHSPALENNLLNDSPDRSVLVYLPPSYRSSPKRRYPVVYLLHGVGDTNEDWISGQYQGMNIVQILDGLAAARAVQEMIVVMPNASNTYEGSFYTNSPLTGNWEDFITRDLVRFTDSTYRSIPDPAGRGLLGHSMGGYGALKLAMKHPDIFSSVYALSPCCIEWVADLSAQNPSWPRVLDLTVLDREAEREFYPKLFISMATAWSPNLSRQPFRVDLPFARADSGLRPAEPAYSEWAANLLLPMALQYRTNLARLRGIGVDYGTGDQFAHIPLGSQDFARFLTANGIAAQVEAYDGDHFDHVRDRIAAHALPFLSRLLSEEPAQGARGECPVTDVKRTRTAKLDLVGNPSISRESPATDARVGRLGWTSGLTADERGSKAPDQGLHPTVASAIIIGRRRTSPTPRARRLEGGTMCQHS